MSEATLTKIQADVKNFLLKNFLVTEINLLIIIPFYNRIKILEMYLLKTFFFHFKFLNHNFYIITYNFTNIL